MSYFWAEMTSTLLRKAGPGFCPSYLIVPSSVPWKWAYWSKFEFEKLKTTWEVFIVSHLKSWTESRNRGRVKIVCFTSSCRFRELPELVIVVLDPNQGGDHGEGPARLILEAEKFVPHVAIIGFCFKLQLNRQRYRQICRQISYTDCK